MSDDEVSTFIQRPFDPTPAPSASFRIGTLVIDDNAAGALYVGSGESSDLRIADRAVSRRHFSVTLEEHGLRLRDLGSTNGTFVNGVRAVEVLLAGGESITVGATTLTIERGSAVVASLSPKVAFGRMKGASREMRRLYPLCERLAATDVSVVIEGETGTGKEVLAECIHEASGRANGPFIVLDCTAIPPTLVESVLFGHERGAFTGATSAHVGVFEEANGGTLFIDEIGDLDVAMQPKLLRAIERGEVRRVGSQKWVNVNVRVLSATRRNLEAEIEAGRFRDDLFHRLAVARIELPPLRARRGDVAILVEEFCKQNGARLDAIPRGLLATWERASWPGNVRELRNAVARHLALGELPLEEAEAAPVVATDVDTNVPFVAARQRMIDDFERRYVERVLAAHGGNVSQAARASGIARRNFQLLRARTKR